MSVPFEGLPPVIASQRGSEQSLYLRASPRRRVAILCDCANSRPLGHQDLLALAVQDLKNAYQDQPPQGVYSNSLGVWIEFDESGRILYAHMVRPEGFVWLASSAPRSGPNALPAHYQFVSGIWEWQTTPVSLPDHAAQQPQVSAPLEGNLNDLARPHDSAVHDSEFNDTELQHSLQGYLASFPAASEQNFPAASAQYFPAATGQDFPVAAEQYYPVAGVEQYYPVAGLQERYLAVSSQQDPLGPPMDQFPSTFFGV